MEAKSTDLPAVRCREGDLALILFDERGCADNIGRIVRVLGAPRVDDVVGTCWLIAPEYDDAWKVLMARGVVTERRPFTTAIEHPDAWMLPLRGERKQDCRQKEVCDALT